MLRRALPFMLFSIAVSVAVGLAVTMLRMGLIHVDADRILRRGHAESLDVAESTETPQVPDPET